MFTEIVPDTNKPTLDGLSGTVSRWKPSSSRTAGAYGGLVDVGYDRHLRIKKARPKTFELSPKVGDGDWAAYQCVVDAPQFSQRKGYAT